MSIGMLIVGLVMRSITVMCLVVLIVMVAWAVFRVPKRFASIEGGIASPCEGRLVGIECIEGERVRFTFRMTLMDACVIRAPIAGRLVGEDTLETEIGQVNVRVVTPHNHWNIIQVASAGVEQGDDLVIVKWMPQLRVEMIMPKHTVFEVVKIGDRVRVGDPVARIKSAWS